MGTFVIILQDTGTEQVMIMAKGKSPTPVSDPTPAEEMFIALLEVIQYYTGGTFDPTVQSGGEFLQ